METKNNKGSKNKGKRKKMIAFCGGHHTSALPLIDSILEENLYEIIFLGRRNSFADDKNDSLEYLDITQRNVKFYEIRAPKIFGKGIFQIWKIFGAIIKASRILKKEKVDLIMSFGGYLAVPVVIAGYLMRIKIVTHEQTVVTGLGNKFISYFADLILISWQSSAKFFPSHKTKLVGLPIRKKLFGKPKKLFPVKIPLPTILITCGKTGSHRINKFILENLDSLLNSYNIIHQSGDYSVTNDYNNLSRKYQQIATQVQGQYFLQKFLSDDDVSSAFTFSDVVVCRAGAHTIYEILHFQKKSLLIPIANVSHNEQFLNANIIYDAGLGLILPEESLNLENFNQFIHKLLHDTFYLKNKELQEQVSKDSTNLILHEIQKILN